ncbi:Glucose oxidase [Apiospora aurea]|uniref:Glucose oxidase n=1 Tax=Apiospora aurea TaxID=335848 RepID=A0ABR1PRG0_9PEZI
MRASWTLAFISLAAAGCVKRAPAGGLVDGTDGTYDYIVVGGGTSGLVVAKRLSEDPKVSVLVLEAGGSLENNANVTNPLGYGLAFGTEIDYAYQTVEQKYAGGKPQTLRAGKGLGGTSTINGLAYTRAESNQIDLWEKMGNEGWNWKNLLPYYVKSEHLDVPNAERLEGGKMTFDAAVHGKEGPLKTGWLYGTTNSTLGATLNTTFAAMGVPWNADANDGSMAGYTVYPSTVDQDLNIREDAARAYYFPIRESAKNLKVMLNTEARRLTWKTAAGNGTAGAAQTAEGVEIMTQDGKTMVMKAKKEVILSAGALVSPLLLEKSGVGNKAILAAAGIKSVVDLPTVGENLQDQANNGLKFGIANNFTETDKNAYVAYPTAEQVFGKDNVAAVAAKVKAALPGYAQQVASVNGNVTKAADLEKFFNMQYDLIFDEAQPNPIAEVLLYQQGGVWDSEYWGLLPFSRGNLHVTAANASTTSATGAKINPNFFMLGWDVTQQVGAANFIRRMYGTAPFKDVVGPEDTPGLKTVPADADEKAMGDWLKQNYRSNFHPVGTAAMMPREVGGVVDSQLKVYGTANVRVVDASILPFQVCGHLVSTLYAVSERASDLIKASAKA